MSQTGTPIKVLYVLGPGRSGTGILGRVLSTMEGAVFAGELRRLWSRGLRPGRTCACGRPHAECPVWSRLLVPGAPFAHPSLQALGAIQARVAPEHLGWRAGLRLRHLQAPPAPDTPEGRYLAAYTALHEAFARVTGAQVVIDSSKSAADASLLAVRREVPTSIVQIVRDPRGVAFSLQQHYAKDASGLRRHLLALRGAVRWVAKHLTNEALRRRYGPDRSIVLHYERLIEDPRSVVEEVAKTVGLAAPAIELSPGVPIEVPEVHGPDGSKRRRFVPTQIVLRLDTRWQAELDPVDRFLVTAVTFPLLLRYGYPLRTPRPSASTTTRPGTEVEG
ncbi:MAG TPA: sulfotransferase [Actinomycetota bacterium]|jgi:hypothetical protein|nr:sulfotransferase [Actinomycetota bacterium]